MFAPEFTYKKCPWWHRLFRRFKWFRRYCHWCTPIEFKSVTLPVIWNDMPTLYLKAMANVMPLIGDANAY